jgi:DNA (cytosine-5)-methyltransferase 1
MTDKLKILDLFSGIGGFSLGLESTGLYETVAFCEIDIKCQAVLEKHWPLTPIYNDINKLSGNDFKNIDVICGGFPCQDISIAGKKKGFKDEHGNRTRSGLWEEMFRIISEARPKYAIIENVSNLLNKGLARVLSDLASIGYDAEWHIISARSVGALHQRERIWIISYPNNNGQYVAKGQFGQLHNDPEWQSKDKAQIWSNSLAESCTNSPILSRRAIEFSRNSNSEVFATESSVCRVTDGVPTRLHEIERRERIKQLGNSVVPQILTLIGGEIAKRIEEKEK